MLIHVGLFLLLCLFYNYLSHFLSFMHSLSKYLGLFIAKAFVGHYRSYRSIPIKRYSWLISIKWLKWRHFYIVMREHKLCIVYYRQQFQPVILVVINEGAESLVEVLVHNLGLAVSLRVECSKKLNLNFKNVAEFVPKV